MIKLYNNNCLKIITNDTNINAGKITVPESRWLMKKFIISNIRLINHLVFKLTGKPLNRFLGVVSRNISHKELSIKTNVNTSWKSHFICMEDFRNINNGSINKLIVDNTPYSYNKIGDFGYLKGDTKPLRINFIKLSKTHKMLEYISTPKYNKHNPKMITFNDMKKYKYLIDLPGHTYSTKIYSYLHCKRVIFRVKERRCQFNWEKYLIPNVHFIEVNNDFSNLIEKYRYLENNPTVYKQIVKNCSKLISTKLNKKYLDYCFLTSIFSSVKQPI